MVRINPIQAQRGIDTGSAPSTARDDSIGQGIRQIGAAVGNFADAQGTNELRLLKQKQKMQEFGVEQEWQRTQLELAAKYDKAKTEIDPSGAGFAETINKEFIGQYDAFLAKVPDELKPRFQELVATDKDGRLLTAAADEVAQRNQWYEVGVGDTVKAAQSEVAAYPEQFDQKLADVKRTIDATGLPPAKREDLKRNAEQMLGRAWFERLMRDDPAFAKTQLGVGAAATGDATGLIKSFEGFRTSAYADTRTSTGEFDAWRTGYGSDTVTRADGKVEKVTASTVVTPEDAERDLQRRVGLLNRDAKHAVGDAWDALPANARAGLLSVAYNYGSLPESVRTAARTGDVEKIAAAVGALSANPERRAKEAAAIRGSMDPAPEVANLPFAERQTYFDQATAAENSLQTQRSAQAKAQYESVKGGLELAIEKGEVASEQSILNAPLLDGDKATLLSKFHTQQGKDASARAFLDAYSSGQTGSVNPYDADQRKIAGDAYELLMGATPKEQRSQVTADYVRSTGVVPDQVVAVTRQNLASTQAADVAAGLEQAAMLKSAASDGLVAVEHGKELADAAAAYDHYVNDRGMSVDEAARLYAEAHDPKAKEKADVLKKRWTEDAKGFSVNDVIAEFGDTNGILPGGQASAGVTPYQVEAITADYLDIAEQKYVGEANGDAVLAKKLALEEIKKTYGVSASAGGAIMKYPPESFYPAVGGDQTYIRDLALKDGKTIDPEAMGVMLQSSPETAQDVRAGQPPRYNLWIQNKDGVWDMAPDLFQVGADDIRGMQAIESEKNRINFEIERDYQNLLAAPRTLAPGAAPTRYSYPPTRQAVPNYAEQQAKIQALTAQRNVITGAPTAAPASSNANSNVQLDPAEQERLMLLQRSQAYGMGGGAQ